MKKKIFPTILKKLQDSIDGMVRRLESTELDDDAQINRLEKEGYTIAGMYPLRMYGSTVEFGKITATPFVEQENELFKRRALLRTKYHPTHYKPEDILSVGNDLPTPFEKPEIICDLKECILRCSGLYLDMEDDGFMLTKEISLDKNSNKNITDFKHSVKKVKEYLGNIYRQKRSA